MSKKIATVACQSTTPLAKHVSTKEFVAIKLGCEPDELINYREEQDGTIVALAPDGRKYRFVMVDNILQVKVI